jgi:hypothetical protein
MNECYYIKYDMDEPECCIHQCPLYMDSCNRTLNICQECEDELKETEDVHVQMEKDYQAGGKW